MVKKSITTKRTEEDEVGEIVAIWIKRAHRGPMDRVDEATLVAGRGLEGSADQGGWRQLTIISEEAWRDAVADLGEDFDPSHRRANVMVRVGDAVSFAK